MGLYQNLENGAADLGGESSVYLSKTEQHDLTLRTLAIKHVPTTNPERSKKIAGQVIPGMNFIVECEVVAVNQSTQADIVEGQKISLFWKLDPGMSEQQEKFALKEITECVQYAAGQADFGDAKELCSEDAPFEDETRFAGIVFRLISKPPKKGSEFRNFGYARVKATDDLVAPASISPKVAPTTEAVAAPTVVETKTTGRRRGAIEAGAE